MACSSEPACAQYREELNTGFTPKLKRTGLRHTVGAACTDDEFDAVMVSFNQQCPFHFSHCCLSIDGGQNLSECIGECVDSYVNAEPCIRDVVLEKCKGATAADANAFASCNTAIGLMKYPMDPVFCGSVEETLFGLPKTQLVYFLVGFAILAVFIIVRYFFVSTPSAPAAEPFATGSGYTWNDPGGAAESFE